MPLSKTLWIALLTLTTANAQDRKALVLGNDVYPNLPIASVLVDSVVSALQTDGFEVHDAKHLNSRQEFDSATTTLANSIKPNDVAVFYFLGRATQVDGQNFLLPEQFASQDPDDIKRSGFPLSLLQKQLEATRARLKVVILDATGLAEMKANPGTLMATASSPESASAGQSAIAGIFTGSLVKALQIPGMDLEDLFTRVRSDVLKQSQGRQIPWFTSNAPGPFQFARGGVIASILGDVPPSTTKPQRIGGNVMRANLISQTPRPVYPEAAKLSRTEGVVVFRALIGKDGHVVDLTLLSGEPVLVEAARESAIHWVYKPTIFNGDAVEVATTISVNFRLKHATPPAP